MDSPASPPAPDASIKIRLAALDRQIKELRRNLDETLDLIERLRANCGNIKAKLADAEREYAALLKDLERF
jgi:chromosome segregation ATPase